MPVSFFGPGEHFHGGMIGVAGCCCAAASSAWCG